jgi:hypothetical protein
MTHQQFTRFRSANALGTAALCFVLTASVTWGKSFVQDKQNKATTDNPLPPLPIVQHPADSAELIADTYRFAAEHPEILRYMPCFCICSKTVHHRSNEDCFISARGKNHTVVWNDHAAECPICLGVARDARAMFLQGHDATYIRAEIDRIYGSRFANRTDTPLPPATPR